MNSSYENSTEHPFYEQAENWYNSTPKAEILAFCQEQGLDLNDGDQLKEDWNSEAIACRVRFLAAA